MSDDLRLADVVRQYQRHDWVPRRLLIASATRFDESELADAGLEAVETRPAAIDAIWFSRRSNENSESWELRRLTGTPYALVIVIDDDTPEADREEAIAATEQRLTENSTRFTDVNLSKS